jgi:hypothetical protein
MNSFIFVAVICVNQSCQFVSSTKPIAHEQCVKMKKEFHASQFKKEVTLAATQCMEFDGQPKKDSGLTWL